MKRDRPTETPLPPSLLPDFCAAPAVFLLVLVAELLALLLTLAGLQPDDQFWVVLGLKSLFIQWVVLSSAALLCGLARRLRHWQPGALGLLSFALIQAVTLLYSLLVVKFAPLLGYGGLAVRAPTLYLLGNLGISSIAALVLLRYLWLQQRWRQQVQAEAQARMQALQARIRPHFLFNSLNTIANLIHQHPDQAEQAVLDLADLFRAALRGHDTLTLGEELDLTRGYLRLQSLRFGERLRADWQLADALPLELPVPALILQPLVENAVVHGVQPSSEPVDITVAAHLSPNGRKLRFAISNPLPLGETDSSASGAGMALDNVRQRLALAYGDRAGLKIQPSGGVFEVILELPVDGLRA